MGKQMGAKCGFSGTRFTSMCLLLAMQDGKIWSMGFPPFHATTTRNSTRLHRRKMRTHKKMTA